MSCITNTELLPIIYQDEWLIAINKPASLLVHRSMIDKHEKYFAMQMLRDQIGQYVYPVHRLDKPTSGVLLFALNTEIAQALGKQFTDGSIKKSYHAIVRGFCDAQGCIDYVLKEELDKITDKKAQQNKAAQPAITDYQCLAKVELSYPVGRYLTARYSLLHIVPKTGRKHQIRHHMKHVFHPIIGDTTHGDGKHNRLFRSILNSHQLLLAATGLSFIHPVRQKKHPFTNRCRC